MRFVDLFSGIGGFHMALTSRGHECVFASEIEERIAGVYELNHRFKPAGDITQIPADQIPDHDILCAGFPCQSFSILGHRKGFQDSRGLMFYEIIRIAKEKRPEIMILENTRNILSIHNGTVVKEIYNQITNIGYSLDHTIINAADCGLAQSRRRVFFVAIRKDSPLFFWHPDKDRTRRYLEDILLPYEQTEHLKTRLSGFVFDKEHPKTNIHRLVRIGYIPNKYGEKTKSQFSRIHSPKGLAGCVLSKNDNLYHIDNIVRNLHMIELKRLMGLPESFQLSPGLKGVVELGNAVVPEVVKRVLDGIR